MEEQQPTQQPQAVINNQPAVPAKPPKKKSGVGKKILVVLLVLIIAAGAGFAGYTYASNQAQKDTDVKVAELQSQINELKSAQETSQTSATTNNSQQALVIKEWGVQIPLNDKVADASYILNDGNTIAKISTVSANENDPSCAQSGPLGTITRSKTESKEAVYVEGYYYSYTTPQSACDKDPTGGTNPHYDDLQAFKLTVSSVEKAE